MRPARVCLFTDSRDPSGMGVHMLTLAAGLQARYDLAVACPIDSGGRELLARCREQGLATLAAPRQTDVGSLRDWLSAHAFDVFHAHAGIGWEGHAAIRAARLAQVPAVIRTEHLPYVLDDARQMREHAQLVPMVDRLIVVSDGVAASFLAAGVPAKKLRVVRNGIGPGRARRSAWLRAAVRQRSGLPADAHLALTVARLSEQKAHATLLAAIPSVLTSRPDLR